MQNSFAPPSSARPFNLCYCDPILHRLLQHLNEQLEEAKLRLQDPPGAHGNRVMIDRWDGATDEKMGAGEWGFAPRFVLIAIYVSFSAANIDELINFLADAELICISINSQNDCTLGAVPFIKREQN